MVVQRPYFRSSISDLEAAFEASRANPVICQALLAELSHHNSDRAAALRRTIESGRTPDQALVPTPQAPRNDPPRHAPPRTVPPPLTASNAPEAILGAWTAVEALSPQTYRRPADLANGDTSRVARLNEDALPWTRNEQSRPNYQLYYQVVLGSIPVDRATDALIQAFGEDEERTRREREHAALAAVLVDRSGLLLEDSAVAISSFGWALPIALRGQLDTLGGWPRAEKALVQGLTQQLSRADPQGKPLPLDATTLHKAYRWLVQALKLPEDLHEAPSFALRIYHYFRSKNPPEVALLNSFFLSDLTRVAGLVDEKQANLALERYLGIDKPRGSPNLLESHALIETLIAPSATPVARWPAPGGHPLVTLQQAAVNAARSDLMAEGAGLVAVNGPPGTGKTTLLRDVVAACVLDRAIAMARIETPASAFRPSGQRIAAGAGFLHLYALDASLKGHEVVVASSNNKAVENISRELPALKAVGREFRYFKTVSDRLGQKVGERGSPLEGEPTWGLIAAVLGNASNRAAFQDAMWWDEDKSLRLYLKAAKGDVVVREIKNEQGELIERKVPTIITSEAPPSPGQAQADWKAARTRFQRLHREVENELESLEAVRQLCLQVPAARSEMAIAQHARESAERAWQGQREVCVQATAKRQAADVAFAYAERLERQAYMERPAWWHRLFNTERMRRWRTQYAPLQASCEAARQLALQSETLHDAAQCALDEAEVERQSAQTKLTATERALLELEDAIAPHRERLGTRLVDETFFAQGHASWNLSSPWIPDALHRKREDLFAAALDLHRAFINAAAQKISHNLGVLMGAMQAGAFPQEAKKALLPDLWSTLFLVCPVVSTTFASVDRMLGDLPANSLGWVLVDEAGQATPQAAAGLLMRARKAIVVGDPLQIPPVVALPQRLLHEVARYFGVDADRWLAPNASAQTLADQASHWKAEYHADVGVREVGIPLLVHRRCQEPMFGICNRMAYDGQMVHATEHPSAGAIMTTLGPSQWIQVEAHADSKWCPAEGEAVIQMLSALAQSGVQRPDLYVITPFRVVAQALRTRIASEPGLLHRLGVDTPDWLRDRVGTIHTFQGKEAEAVIAVLGAPMATQNGARQWAASTPNILNVMVSRAKQALYVVGSHAAWSTVGHGRTLAAPLAIRDDQ